MNRSILCAGLLISSLGFLDLGIAPNTSAAPETVAPNQASSPVATEVVMRNMLFSPATIEIKKGDTVEWKNEEIIPHTATSPSFNSGPILSNQSWRHQFTEAGTFNYGCTYHPTMKGIVIVK